MIGLKISLMLLIKKEVLRFFTYKYVKPQKWSYPNPSTWD